MAALIVGAVAAATALAFAWPSLPWSERQRAGAGPTRVGVISRQIEVAGSSGQVGAPAPDFDWIAPDGRRVALSSLRRPVVVNFWATWCKPCREEMPLLDRTARERTDVAFLAVDLDESGDAIRAFFDELGLVHLEPLVDVDLATAHRYGVLSVPSTFFIDSGGTIRHVQVGALDRDKLAAALAKLR